jgi:capsular exopolysaccharide synthesis family protein
MDNGTVENGGLSSAALDGVMSPETLLYVALRHRWVIFCTVVLSLFVAFVYLMRATPIYTSASRLYVEQSGPKIINEYEGVMTRSTNYLYTQAELIRSTPIVSNATEKPQITRFRTLAGMDNLVGYIRSNLDIAIGKKDDIITVSFDSAYPVEGSQIVNTLVESYIDYHAARKRSTTTDVLRLLQNEKTKRDGELTARFEDLLEFTRENGVVSFDNSGGHVVFQRLTKLSTALTDMQLMTINAKGDYEAVKSMADDSEKIRQFAMASPALGVQIFVNNAEAQLQSDLRNAEIELKNAKYHCTEDHPSIKAINTKIEHIRQQLTEQAKKFADAYIEVMRLKLATAVEREEELQASFDRQCKEAQELGVKATEYSILQSESERTKRLCEILDDRIKELSVTEDARVFNINILEYARPAPRPSKPQKARVMTIALFFGLMLGGGLALLRDWMDHTLRSAEEISAILAVPILGVVPRMTEVPTIVTCGQKVWLDLKPFLATACQAVRRMVFFERTGKEQSKADVIAGLQDNGQTTAEKHSLMECSKRIRSQLSSMSRTTYRSTRASVLSAVSENQSNGVCETCLDVDDSKTVQERQDIVARGQKVHLKPKSVVAEAYRTIRTAVFFGVPKDEAKTIVITSPAAGDGKSTLVSNLAIAMAQAGQRTLVLDADFRKPMQHNIFEVDSQKGISSVLAGVLSVEQAVQTGPVGGLDILPCGPDVPNPSELLNSNLFTKVLEDLTQRYDRVLIDSPPVGVVADSQILAALCDITLLVLRAEKSTRKQSQQARDGLLSVGGHIVGAVVNDVPQRWSNYGYYTGYGHYGGYGYNSSYGYYGNREKRDG